MTDKKTKTSLSKHLLETMGSKLLQIAKCIHFLAVVSPQSVPLCFSIEDILAEYGDSSFPDDSRRMLNAIETELESLHTVDTLWKRVSLVFGAELSVEIEKMINEKNEKKDYMNSLRRQLDNASGEASSLHLAVLLLFEKRHKLPLFASGKFVPSIIKFGSFDEPIHSLLMSAISCVKTRLGGGRCDDTPLKEVCALAAATGE